MSISILYTIFKIWRSELHSGIQCSFIFESTGSIRAHRSWKVRESTESLLTFSLISFCCPPQSPTWLTSTAAVPYSTGSTRSPPAQWKMWFPWDSGAIRQKGFWFTERDREEISSLWSFREEDLFCILIWVREKEGLDTIQIDLISFYSHSCTCVSMDQKVKLEIKEKNLRCSEFRCMPEFFAFKGIVQPKNLKYLINYSPSCHSRSLRPLFIFRTQIKIFMMKYESFLLNINLSYFLVCIFWFKYVRLGKKLILSVKISRHVYEDCFMYSMHLPLLVNKVQCIWVLVQNAGSCVSSSTRMHRDTLVNARRRLTGKRRYCWMKSLFLFSLHTKSILVVS